MSSESSTRTHIELSTVKANEYITKSNVHDAHMKRLLNNKSNNSNTKELVEILGGIDKILTDYLSSTNNMPLTHLQLINIHKIINKNDQLTSPLKESNESNKSKSSKKEINENESQKLVYTFIKTDTFIHNIFGNEKGTKIINILYNKILLIFMVLQMITLKIWEFVLTKGYTVCILNSIDTFNFFFVINK